MPAQNKFKKTISVWDWKSIPSGTYFKATLSNGTVITGVVMQDKDNEQVELCTNDDAAKVPWYDYDDSGFKYYFPMEYRESAETALNDNGIKSLSFPNPPASFKMPMVLPKMAGYTPEIKKGKVVFGCQSVSNAHIRLLAENLIN